VVLGGPGQIAVGSPQPFASREERCRAAAAGGRWLRAGFAVDGFGGVREAKDPGAAATAYSELARLVSARVDPLLRVVLGSRDADQALGEFAKAIDNERLVGSRWYVRHWHSAGWLRSALTVNRATEILWALNSPEPRWLLHDRGWSDDEFASWLADMIRLAIFA
jgi:hypothetical protein